MRNRIREFRERRDLSQDEVAKILGVNRTAVVKWETGANRDLDWKRLSLWRSSTVAQWTTCWD